MNMLTYTRTHTHQQVDHLVKFDELERVAESTNNKLILAFLRKAHDDQVTDVYKFFYLNEVYKLALMNEGLK